MGRQDGLQGVLKQYNVEVHQYGSTGFKLEPHQTGRMRSFMDALKSMSITPAKLGETGILVKLTDLEDSAKTLLTSLACQGLLQDSPAR